MISDILAIHGAFSSPRIFNYLKGNSNKHYQWHFVDYQNITDGVSTIISSITPPADKCHVIGHSMGGLIALGLLDQTWVSSITTIATPLGGVDSNPIQNYFSRSGFINEIASHGDFIRRLHTLSTNKPVQHIISSEGFNPWMWEKTDGVITVKSQRAWKLGETHDVCANHAEVMLDDHTVELIVNFWNKCNS